MAALLTPRDLELTLQQSILAADLESAQAACVDATNMVRGHLTARFATADADQLESIRSIAKGIASQIFSNPQSRSNYSGPEGLTFTAPPRSRNTLFQSERDALDALFLPGFA